MSKTEKSKLFQTEMAFLPGEAAALVPAGISGTVQLNGSVADGLRELAAAMRAEGTAPVPGTLAAADSLARSLQAGDAAQRGAWRGLLALCLLWDGWPKDEGWPELELREIRREDGRLASALLNGLENEPVPALRMILLKGRDENGEKREALGLAGGGTAVVPALRRAVTMMPGRITWFDAESGWSDPSPLLPEADRARLLAGLEALGQSASVTVRHELEAFSDDLLEVRRKERDRIVTGGTDASEALRIRFSAALGLPGCTEFSALERRADGLPDPQSTCALLELYGSGMQPAPAQPDERRAAWLWQGTPVAWESSVLGFEATNAPGEEEAMAELSREIGLMEANSAVWNGRLAQRFAAWQEQNAVPGLMRGEVAELVSGWREDALRRGDHPEKMIELTWPWRAEDPAVRSLMREAFGDAGADAASQPFSAMLTLFDQAPAGLLADAALRDSCVFPTGSTQPEALAMPPVSVKLAAAAQAEKIAMDLTSLRFAKAGDGIKVTMEAAGERRVRWIRVYEPDEIAHVAAEAVPAVSVWPCVRFADASWKEYHLYAHGAAELTVHALEGETVLDLKKQQGQDGSVWALGTPKEFPAWMPLKWRGRDAGALPNIVPPFMIRHEESAVVGLDFGTTGTSVAIRQGDRVLPMNAPSLQRIVLASVREAPLEDEFIPQAPVAPILFSAEDAFTDRVENWREPLVDGHVYTPLSFMSIARKDPGRLYYDLKWGIEPFRESINRLFLSQVMTTACLIARMNGAPDCSWRVAMPGAMARDGRASYFHMMERLAKETAERTGFGLTPGVPPVSYATESLAASMYFRSRSEVNVRGGFVMIDVGGGTAELSLWLRGMKAPAITCSLPLGSQFMLLDSMLEHPGQMEEDFGTLADQNVLREMRLLPEQFRRAKGSLRLLQKSRFMLDAFIGQHMDELSRTMNEAALSGRCTRTQALLLLNFSFLMMLCGQLEQRAYSDNTINHLLAPRMQICVSGRGSLLMMGLDSSLLSRLHRFVALPMSADHPTREHVLVVSGAPKMEVATGLLHLKELETGEPAEIAETGSRGRLDWQPAMLMSAFLTAFNREFPAAAAVLFPNLYDGEGQIRQDAAMTIRMICDNCFVTLEPHDPVGYAAALAGLRGRV